jgi:hypothetical protein
MRNTTTRLRTTVAGFLLALVERPMLAALAVNTALAFSRNCSLRAAERYAESAQQSDRHSHHRADFL